MPRGKANTQTYVVTGTQSVLGRAAGDRITSADFEDEIQERRLVESGAIAQTESVVDSGTQTSSDQSAGASDKE